MLLNADDLDYVEDVSLSNLKLLIGFASVGASARRVCTPHELKDALEESKLCGGPSVVVVETEGATDWVKREAESAVGAGG